VILSSPSWVVATEPNLRVYVPMRVHVPLTLSRLPLCVRGLVALPDVGHVESERVRDVIDDAGRFEAEVLLVPCHVRVEAELAR
jgi:hypothetical protein